MQKMQSRIVLLFGEAKMGKSSFIATLTQSRTSPVQSKQIEVTQIDQDRVTYHFIDSFSKTSFFEDDDYPFILSSKLEEVQQLKQNNNMIDSILLFQSVAESTIQINLTIEELKKIFPFLSNKGLIVVITKFERSYDEQKLKNLKTTLDKKAIPYIEWVNSCSTKCLTNDDYFQNQFYTQWQELRKLLNFSVQSYLQSGLLSQTKQQNFGNKMLVDQGDYKENCQNFNESEISIPHQTPEEIALKDTLNIVCSVIGQIMTNIPPPTLKTHINYYSKDKSMDQKVQDLIKRKQEQVEDLSQKKLKKYYHDNYNNYLEEDKTDVF